MADVRLILATIVVLVVPGLVLTAALFRTVRLDLAERVAITLSLSVALAILSGLGLAAAGIALGVGSWLTAVVLTTLLGAALAAPLRWRRWDVRPLRAERWTRTSFLRLGGFGLAVALAVAGLAVANQAAVDQPRPPYTSFWLVPDGSAVQVGAQSAEAGATTYRVVVSVGGAVVQEWPAVTLAPGQAWTSDIAVSPTAPAVEADLFRAGDATPYRHVTWPGAASPAPSVAPPPTLPSAPSPSPSSRPAPSRTP